MLFETTGQAYVFLATLYVGVLAGLLYDVMRILRVALVRVPFTRHILDGLFWAGTAALFVLALLRANDGHLRGYTLLGCAVGWMLYGYALSPLIKRLLGALYRGLAALWRAFAETPLAKRLLK